MVNVLLLSSHLKPAAYRPVFQKYGRLHIPDVLDQRSAAGLERLLSGHEGWTRAITVEGAEENTPYTSSEVLKRDGVTTIERVPAPKRQTGVQFLFDMHSISTVRHKPIRKDPRFQAVGDFLNGPAFLDFARSVTGDDRIQQCDAIATRYLPEHFLTPHNDANFGENRLYAYVLNLSPAWRMEWGGLLAFLDEDGHVAEAYTPAFNALNIFRVPQQHAVTMVNRLAQAPRLSLTGWLHGPAPGG